MASGELLRKLVKSGADGNYESFRQVSEEVIREEREKRHYLLANDLEKILYGRTSIASKPLLSLVKQIPSDKERAADARKGGVTGRKRALSSR